MPKRQLSSIKPNDPKIQPKPIIEYNNLTWKSYIDQGFIPPIELDKWERRFLSRLDPKKGASAMHRTVNRIYRTEVLDTSGDKPRRRQILYYMETWTGKDIIGRSIPPHREHWEGLWYEQQSEPKINEETHQIEGYERSGEELRYSIDFSKENVDKIIANSYGSDKYSIAFYVVEKPTWIGTGRRDIATYEQFVNMSWNECLAALLTPGGLQKMRVKELVAASSK